MNFLIGAFLIVGILFMCTFMFIGIWSFIIHIKNYRQIRYQNYILEKMHQKLSSISDNMSNSDDANNDYAYLTGEEDIFDINDHENRDNKITDFKHMKENNDSNLS